MIKQFSPNHNERPAGTAVDMLVLHYTGMESCDAVLTRLCDETAHVSAHYLIDEDGTLYQLVEENRRAWHAGVASWRGVSDVNAHSIGIELVNPGHEFGYRNFPEQQMLCLIDLCKDVLTRHAIVARNVLGHSDVAPARKQDPGELFDWHRLAKEGVGLWPGHAAPVKLESSVAGQILQSIGYDITDLQAALKAFQLHYRPSQVDGMLDEETGGLIKALSGRALPV